jgi:RNase P subunit RPR2
MKKLSKIEAKKEIDEFFSNIKNKTPKEIKKIKRLAMRHNIKLKKFKKMFCKKCYSVYRKPKVRIRNNVKSVSCENCGYVARWKLKS